MVQQHAGADGLSRAAVVTAALELLADTSPQGFSMRLLSERLGVTLGATYRYVASKDELMRLVAAELDARLVLPLPGGDWQPRLRQLVTDFTASMSAYPAVSTYVVQHLPTFNGGRVGRAARALLAESGLPTETVDRGVGTLLLLVLGALSEVASGWDPEAAVAQVETGIDLVLKGMTTP